MSTVNKYKNATFGLAEAVFNKLGGIEGVQRFLRGDTEVTIKIHTIQTDDDPFVPGSWKVVEHQKGGELKWDADTIGLYLGLYLDEAQQDGFIKGEELRKKLEGQSVLNACVLDYLLANPNLIPEEWKSKAVFFWGTIYRDFDGNLLVRYLNWDGVEWEWGHRWLNDHWLDSYPAAVLRKSSTKA